MIGGKGIRPILYGLVHPRFVYGKRLAAPRQLRATARRLFFDLTLDAGDRHP
jgi:hypothetical protein